MACESSPIISQAPCADRFSVDTQDSKAQTVSIARRGYDNNPATVNEVCEVAS